MHEAQFKDIIVDTEGILRVKGCNGPVHVSDVLVPVSAAALPGNCTDWISKNTVRIDLLRKRAADVLVSSSVKLRHRTHHQLVILVKDRATKTKALRIRTMRLLAVLARLQRKTDAWREVRR